MENDPLREPADNNSKEKSHPQKKKNDGGVKTKGRIRWLIVFSLLSVAFLGIAGFLVSFHKDLSKLSIGFLFLFFIASAVGFCIDFERYQGRKKIARRGGTVWVATGFIFCGYLWYWGSRRPPDVSDLTYKAVTNAIAMRPNEPDYIPGTRTTHAKLENQFPFGYVVISFRDGNRLFDPRLRDDQLKIDADWKNIQISPNFATHTVQWVVKFVSIKIPSLPTGMTDLAVQQRYPMDMGIAHRYPASFEGNPAHPTPSIYFVTLSDNQVSPVFLIGFRIAQKTSSN